MEKEKCQVYFIGAGPGDPELMTIKGQKCIKKADLVLYAGSLVPLDVIACARKDARVLDSSSMTLEQTHSLILETVKSGGIVARIHTGDPSLYGAIKEQMALLDKEGIDYKIIPGVTVSFAVAAAAKISFTLPEKTQTLILTRLSGNTPVPDRERLRELATHNASLAIYLSASNPEGIVKELLAGGYPSDTPVVVGYKVGWPDEVIIPTTISDLSEVVRGVGIRRQAIFLILPGQKDEPTFSRLYSQKFTHSYRSAANTRRHEGY